MSKCGKGCMPECEYFTTGGCISPFNCPYKIEENYQNSAFTTGNSNFLSGIEKWFKKLVEEGKIPQTPMNYDTASYQMYVAHLEAENAELKEKAQKLDEQLKAISDRTAKFPSLEQIEKRFLDWAIPFLKARITGCKEEWFGIEWIAKAIWEFIKNDFENAIAVDETNAALRERLDKAVELPYKRKRLLWGDKDRETLLCPDCLTDLMGGIGDETFVVQCPNCGCFVDCMVEPIPFTEAAEARLKELQGEKQ